MTEIIAYLDFYGVEIYQRCLIFHNYMKYNALQFILIDTDYLQFYNYMVYLLHASFSH